MPAGGSSSGKLECGLHGWTPSASTCLSVHDVAASGFGAEAAAYERARPSYPADAVDWIVDSLRLSPGARVCDLAAGTGKFTRLLDARLPVAELVAVEPVEGMRRFLAASLPRVPVVSAIAEACPFAPASFDGDHRGPGLPLVRRPARAGGAPPRAAAGWAAGAGVERA